MIKYLNDIDFIEYNRQFLNVELTKIFFNNHIDSTFWDEFLEDY